MKTEYLYALLDTAGGCWRVDGQGTSRIILPDMLAEGWRPVRETPFAADPTVATPSILLVLEREVEGSFGFGFNPK